MKLEETSHILKRLHQTISVGSKTAANDTRKPLPGYMKYKGNVAEHVDAAIPMGPNYMGEYMWPLPQYCTYDKETNTSYIRFSLQSPPTISIGGEQ